MHSIPVPSRWSGSYAYSPLLAMPPQADVPFTMELRRGLLGGLTGTITGTITDGPGGIPEPADLRGRIRSGDFEFTKEYRSLWVLEEDGVQQRVPGLPSQRIHYTGRISIDGTRLEGIWRLEAMRLRVRSELVEIPTVDGTWSARLEPSQILA